MKGVARKNVKDAKKTGNRRYKSTENLLEMIDRKKTELDSKHPLTEGEAEVSQKNL